MNFNSLPIDSNSILAMTSADYEPYYNDLKTRTLDDFTLGAWLDDWSALACCVDEQFTRLQIVTSQHTADEELQSQFDKYLDDVQPAVKAADQKIKEKLLASGLYPDGFEIAFKKCRPKQRSFAKRICPCWLKNKS